MKETIQHYIFHCQEYHNQRQVLEGDIKEILARNGIMQAMISLKVLTNLDDICSNNSLDLKTAFDRILTSTGSLIKNH